MKTAFIFPGQGSQSIGMLSELADNYPDIHQTFEQASAALNFDIWQLIQQGPESQLNNTEYAQPALLTAGIAIWRLWQTQAQLKPDFLAGHSLGEYTALVAAEVIPFEQAVRLVQTRGRLMQQAVPEGRGAMAAILGMEDEKVVEICSEVSNPDNIVTAANFNSPGQVVVAGHSAAVDQVLELAQEHGGKRSVKLAVSVPSHCPLMQPAADQLQIEFEGVSFGAPVIPVVQNVNAQVNAGSDAIQNAVIQQLYKPVQWSACIQTMASQGVINVFECGPGKVLSGLNRRINRDLNAYPMLDVAAFEKALAATSS